MSVSREKIISKKNLKPSGEKKKFDYQYIFLIMILLLTVIGFIHSIKNDFIFWDDDKQITDNPFIKSFTFSNIYHNFSQEGFTFLPLMTYALDYKIWGMNPHPYHVINLILHLANVVLVYFFIKQISGKYEVALVTCLLFAIHPMRVESVAWISERKDLMFTFFFIVSLIFYDFYIRKGQKIKFLIFSLVFGYLSSLSKIQALSLPFVLLVMDFFYGRKIDIRALVEKLIFFILMFIYIIVGFVSPVLPYFFSLIKKLFILSFYFARDLSIHVSDFYFFRNYSLQSSPVYLLLLVLILFFIFSFFKIRTNFNFKSLAKLRHILFPLVVFLVFRVINESDLILAVFCILNLYYFLIQSREKENFDLTGLISSIVMFLLLFFFFFLTGGMPPEFYPAMALSFLIVLFPLADFFGSKKIKSGFSQTFLLLVSFFIFSLKPTQPLVIILAAWLTISNLKIFKGNIAAVISLIFSVIVLYFSSYFFNNLVLLFPFIFWFAFDNYYLQNKNTNFDFLFHKLILFLLLCIVIFVQSLNIFLEYSVIVLIALVYAHFRESLSKYFLSIDKKFWTIISSGFSLKNIIMGIFGKIISWSMLLYRNKKLIYSITIILIALVFFVEKDKFTFWVQKDVQQFSFGFIDRIFLASYSLVFYIFNFFFPFNLSAIHPYPVKSGSLLPVVYYFSFAGLLLISLTVFYLIRKFSKYRKELIFGLLFFLVNISMVLHIIPIQGRLVAADRYSYLAYLGLFYITGMGFLWIKENKINGIVKNTLSIIFICYLAGFFVYTYNRCMVWKDSMALFNNVIEKDPGISLAYNNRGWSRFNMNDWKSALADYDKAISLDTGFAGVYNNRGWLKYNIGNINGSVEDYNKALRLFPDFSLAYNNRGKARLDLNDNKGALEDFNNAIRTNPLNAVAWSNRAKISIDQKDYKNALRDLDRALELNPDLSLAYFNRGLVKVKQGKTEEGIKDYSEAIKCDSTFAMAYNNRGYAYYLMKNYILAENDYNIAINKQPNFATAYKNRALSRFSQNDYKGALNDLDNAIRIQPDFMEAINNRGYVRILAGDYEGAREDLSIVIRTNPDYANAYNYRGLAMSNLKNYSAAVEDFTKAISLSPDFSDAINNRGWAYFNLKKYNDAIADYKKAISMNKSDVYYKNLAWTYYSMNKFSEAIENYTIALQMTPKNSQSLFYRGMSYFKTGNNAKACSDWKTADEMGEGQAREFLKKHCR